MPTNIPINPITLRFPKKLESIFFEDYFQKSINQVRLALLLAIFFNLISGVLDNWLYPESKDLFWLLDSGAIFGQLFGVFLLTFLPQFKRFMQPTISLLILCIVGSLIGLRLGINKINLYDTVFIILILYNYTAIKLFFVYATLIGWGILAIYNFVAIGLIHTPIPVLAQNNLHLLVANLLGMFANYWGEFYIRKDFLQDRLLAQEREKSERLLLNVLPLPIAEKLKEKPTIIADSFAEATILFADIVGFTQLSARISATELVELLNNVFSKFDQIAERYGLEKIKTIGDAYMVVGGLPTPREDHAEAVAEMALDMQQEMAQFNLDNTEPLSLRIGIHTGSVVAGVIGLKKFIYDLWGDAVNTASRMESHGLANCIQVSQATYELLQPKYQLKKRGVIQVKGKGEMVTYILISRIG
ncbi:MAG: adenylate/guanylate cyclase domain-containing protein [Coleofasciculus sp. C2-GNP5-27]